MTGRLLPGGTSSADLLAHIHQSQLRGDADRRRLAAAATGRAAPARPPVLRILRRLLDG